MRKNFIFILSLGIFLAVSCSSTQSVNVESQNVTAVENVESNAVFVPDEENVKFLGRTYFSDGVLWAVYSSSGAAFKINAKRLELTFEGDSGARVRSANGQTGLARVAVFVNGERKLEELLLKKEQTYTIFESESNVEGEVLVLKISEAANSVAGIKSIITDSEGKISPAEKKSRRIEFIGDSITCGYGVDDLVKEHHFSTATEDNTKTYAYKAALLLDADYSMVSQSGWGVISGYTGDPSKKSDQQIMPKYYEKLGFCSNHFGGISAQNVDWDFSKFVPDVIVINLGTNDDSYCKGNSKKVEEFTKEYENFIAQIRKNNPDAIIICSLGIMGANLYPAIVNAVESYKNKSGDTKVETLQFANQQMSDGIAADWHPSEKTHTKAAALLVQKIRALTNWN